MIAEVMIPDEEENMNIGAYDSKSQEHGGFAEQAPNAKIEIVTRICHDGEVNRARYCPQHPNIIATKTPNKAGAQIYIFDYLRKQNDVQEGVSEPLLKLKGHTKEGYGMCWSPTTEGMLASAGDDKRVCVWHIQQFPKSPSSTAVNPIATFDDHEAVVEDVSFSKQHSHLLASVCDDKKLRLWDLRQRDSGKAMATILAHNAEVNSCDFSPFNEFLLLTSSADKV